MYIVKRIHIYTKLTNTNWHSGFTLETFDESGDTVNNVTNYFPKSVGLLNITLPSMKPVKRLQINSAKWQQTLWEVHTLGDTVCLKNMYGLFCQHDCNYSEQAVCNNATGSCALWHLLCRQIEKVFFLGCLWICCSNVCHLDSSHCCDCFPGHWETSVTKNAK